jgi:PST family polysaccharide transporter
MVAFIGVIASVVLMLSARDFVPLLLGPGWEETGRILMAFCPGLAALLVYDTNSWLHLSLGTPGRWLRWNLISSAVIIVAYFVALPSGAVAVAISYGTAMYLLLLPGFWYAGRPVGLRINNLLHNIWPYFLAGLLTAVIWIYLPVYCKFPLIPLKPLSRVAFTICASPIVYMFIVIILQRNLSSVRELISLLRLLLGR